MIAPAPGGLATVTCPYGGSIKVAGSIAGNVQALLDAAAAQGVSLCASSGWRSPESQIELRRLHCGTSNYAIYYMPSSQCNPPTARPGSSMRPNGPSGAALMPRPPTCHSLRGCASPGRRIIS